MQASACGLIPNRETFEKDSREGQEFGEAGYPRRCLVCNHYSSIIVCSVDDSTAVRRRRTAYGLPKEDIVEAACVIRE